MIPKELQPVKQDALSTSEGKEEASTIPCPEKLFSAGPHHIYVQLHQKCSVPSQPNVCLMKEL
jgi:hypothetical protein